MVSLSDVRWTQNQLSETTVFYNEYQLGHMSFMIAKDMSYFSKDVLAILGDYNNKCFD
jgi:hypothetical protein